MYQKLGDQNLKTMSKRRKIRAVKKYFSENPGKTPKEAAVNLRMSIATIYMYRGNRA